MTAPNTSTKTQLVCVASLVTAFVTTGCASFNGSLQSLAQLKETNQLESSTSLNNIEVSPANWPTSNWWERYGDHQLNQLTIEALKDSPSIRIAEARIRKAMALGDIAESTTTPQVTGNFKAVRQRFSANSITPHPVAGTWAYFVDSALNFSYEIDFWDKNKNIIDASLDVIHASEIDTQAARLVLASSIVQNYVRLAQTYNQLELAELVLKQREHLLSLTNQRKLAGIDSDVDLKQAESAVPVAKQQVTVLKEAVILTCNRLAALMGKGPDRGLIIKRPQFTFNPPIGIPTNIPAELIGRRPDVVAQRWRVEASQREVDAARAQFYPNISIVALAGLQSLGIEDFLMASSGVAAIGPAISLPIFDGGRLRGNLGVRNADYDLAVEQYNQTLIDALHDVVNQITSITWLAEQRSLQIQAVNTAQTAYELAMQRYEGGLATYLQVLNAEFRVHEQKKNLIDLDTHALELDANLVRALGGNTLDS